MLPCPAGQRNLAGPGGQRRERAPARPAPEWPGWVARPTGDHRSPARPRPPPFRL